MFEDVFDGLAGLFDLLDAWADCLCRLVAVQASVEVGSGFVLHRKRSELDVQFALLLLKLFDLPLDLGDLVTDLLAALQHAAVIVAPEGGFPDGVDLALRPRRPQLVALLLVVVGSAHDLLVFEAVARNGGGLCSVDRVLPALEARNVLDGRFRVVVAGLVVAAQSSKGLVDEGFGRFLRRWLLGWTGF